MSEGVRWFVLFALLLAALAWWIFSGMGVVLGLLVAIAAGILLVSYSRRGPVG